MLKALSFLLTLLVLSGSCLVKYSSKVAKQVFQQNEIYLLFVKMQVSSVQEQEKKFDWCHFSLPSALSYPTSKSHLSLINFIGYNDSNFFAIIDTANKKKYLYPFQTHSVQEITFFVDSFQKSTLVPFYASEPLPSEVYDEYNIYHLVGKNYQSFLIKQSPIKIVYLHTLDSMCTFCAHMMRQFQQISQKESQQGVLIFGAIDVIKNDNSYIADEIFPYFLIYVGDNLEDPFGVDAQEFKQMEMYINQLKKDYKQMASKQQNVDDSQNL